MAMKIKQGDAYAIPVAIEWQEEPLNTADVAAIEFVIGGIRKLYPGEVSYDAADGYFTCRLRRRTPFLLRRTAAWNWISASNFPAEM